MARILWCEDSARVRQLIELIFRKSAHDLQLFESPTAAIDDYTAYGADLIVTDLRMPEMDGLALVKELRRRGAVETPVIVCSASSNHNARVAIEAAGATYLPKPFSSADLNRAVAVALDRLAA